jgi:predicted ATPase
MLKFKVNVGWYPLSYSIELACVNNCLFSSCSVLSAYMDCVVFLMLVGLCNHCLCDLMLYCQFTKAVDLFVAYCCIV